MYTLTLCDTAEHAALGTPADESSHSSVEDAVTALEDTLRNAGRGDTAHAVLEYRGPSEREFVVYSRDMAPVGTARVTREYAAVA